MKNDAIIQKLIEDVGYIKAKVEGLDDLVKKVNQHDVVLGKVGLAFTLIIFVATIVVSVATDFVKKLWA